MSDAVLYFSRAGENYADGKIVDLKIGNTEKLACKIAFHLNCPLYRVIPKKAYSENYEECTEEAKKDLEDKAFPELFTKPNLSSYDRIFIGFPLYWGDLPRPLCTAIKSAKIDRSKIYLFATHEGGEEFRCLETMKELLPEAEVKSYITCYGNQVDNEVDRILNWIDSL